MKNRKEGIIGDLLPDHSEAFDYIRELHEYLWRVVKVAVPGASGNLKDYLPAAIVILEGRRASCLLCGEPKPLIIDRRGQSVCEDCYVRGINTRAGAEPATSVRLSRGSDQVGRTGDSISPTGAALSSTERPPTENRASLIEKLRATGAKRNRLLMRQAANHIERLERIIKSAPVFDASHNSGEGLPNGDSGASTERETPRPSPFVFSSRSMQPRSLPHSNSCPVLPVPVGRMKDQ